MSNQELDNHNLHSENRNPETDNTNRQSETSSREPDSYSRNTENCRNETDHPCSHTDNSTRHIENSRNETDHAGSHTDNSTRHIENIRNQTTNPSRHPSRQTDNSRRPPQNPNRQPDNSAPGLRFLTPDGPVPLFPDHPLPHVTLLTEWPSSDSDDDLSDFSDWADEDPGLGFTLPVLGNGVAGLLENTSNTLDKDKADHPVAFTLVNLVLWVVMILFVVLPVGVVSAVISVPVSILMVVWPHHDIYTLSDLLELAQLLPAICVKQMLVNGDFLTFLDLDLQLLV